MSNVSARASLRSGSTILKPTLPDDSTLPDERASYLDGQSAVTHGASGSMTASTEGLQKKGTEKRGLPGR